MKTNGGFSHYNFAFGSNLTERLMLQRCGGDARLVGRGVLRDHRLEFVDGLATVVAAPGESVPGLVYDVTTEDGLRSLDRCEGVPTLYTRERVDVELEGIGPVSVSTYKMVRRELGAPSGHYLASIVNGARAHGVDAAHVLEAVERAERGERTCVRRAS